MMSRAPPRQIGWRNLEMDPCFEPLHFSLTLDNIWTYDCSYASCFRQARNVILTLYSLLLARSYQTFLIIHAHSANLIVPHSRTPRSA